jgi:hypothetical protein
MNQQLVELGERTLRRSDSEAPVRVTVFVPSLDIDGGFRCCYRIKGLGDGALRFGAGTDAIQALQIALQKIGVDLHFNRENVRLTFGDLPDSGFPLPSSRK